MRGSLLLLIAVALAVPAVLAADAKPKDDKPHHERHVDPEKSTPEARAAKRAKDINGGGRVLSVSPDENGHRVKVLKKGEVKVIHVPDDDERAAERPPEH